tara:strand:+ start:238 stop:477 length:240 start_codon:yes stop_codon:yes gene_type:complete
VKLPFLVTIFSSTIYHPKIILKIKMENKDKLLESIQELKKGLDLLSRDRKVVMPHNKAFDHVDVLKVKVEEIIKLAETV